MAKGSEPMTIGHQPRQHKDKRGKEEEKRCTLRKEEVNVEVKARRVRHLKQEMGWFVDKYG